MDLQNDISATQEVVILKAFHRGTQTEIHCEPFRTKQQFIDMIVKSRF